MSKDSIVELSYEYCLELCSKNKCYICKHVPNNTSISYVKKCFVTDRFQNNLTLLLKKDNLGKWIKEDVYIILTPDSFNDEESIIEVADSHIVAMLCNVNGVHLLNYGDLSKYPALVSAICYFTKKAEASFGTAMDFLIDSTATMGLYGIRPVGDLDFLTEIDNYEIIEEEEKIEANFKYVQYHSDNIHELLYSPKYYIPFFGCKVVALEELLKWKILKGEKKDMEDALLIRLFLEHSNRYSIYRAYIIMKRNIKIAVFKILVPLKRRLKKLM